MMGVRMFVCVNRHTASPSCRPCRAARCTAQHHSNTHRHAQPTKRAILGGSALLALTPLLAANPALGLSTKEALEKEFGKEMAQLLMKRQGEVSYTSEEWKERLEPLSYRVLRLEATEKPYSSPLNNENRVGTFCCAGCGQALFASTTKFESGTGWPSFFDALPGGIKELPDYSIPFLPRTEVRCSRCEGHIGHVFADGPQPTGLRYCMNGAAMVFKAKNA